MKAVSRSMKRQKAEKLKNDNNSKEKETFGCILMCFMAVEYMYTNGGSDNSHNVKKKKKRFTVCTLSTPQSHTVEASTQVHQPRVNT